MNKVIVIGAGISGLTAAFYLMRQGCEVEIFEKEDRAGGVIQTIRQDGYLFEKGPNSFLDNAPDTLELCRDLKLENEFLKQSMHGNDRFVFLDGELHNVPMGPGGLIKTKLLSGKAKRRLMTEIFRGANRSKEDESLASFVRRRLGDEVLTNLVTPFVSGVYAGDPEKLSLRGTFPILYDLERDHGGLVRGVLAKVFKRKKGADAGKEKPRPKNLCSFIDGMETNTQAMTKALGDRLHLQSPVTAIQPEAEGGYSITVDGAADKINAQAVILAAPAYSAADMLKPLMPDSADYLGAIPYNALSLVGMGYSRDAIARQCNGFGFLSPRGQAIRILGSIWNSSLFPRRAPGGCCSFSVFIGGGLDPAAFQLSDDEISVQIKKDLKIAIGAQGEPEIQRIFRWKQAIPQYPVGHVEQIEALNNQLTNHPGLHCIGNYLSGVSSNDCIRIAKETAHRVNGFIRKSA